MSLLRRILGWALCQNCVRLENAIGIKMAFNDYFVAILERVGNDSLMDYWQTIFSLNNGKPQCKACWLPFHRTRDNLSIYPHILAID